MNSNLTGLVALKPELAVKRGVMVPGNMTLKSAISVRTPPCNFGVLNYSCVSHVTLAVSRHAQIASQLQNERPEAQHC